jgi:AAA domain (Cdc48 subfamily)
MSDMELNNEICACGTNLCRNVVGQLRHILARQFPYLHIESSRDGLAFSTRNQEIPAKGILSLAALVSEEQSVCLHIELVRAGAAQNIDMRLLWNGISSLSWHCHPLETRQDADTGQMRYFVELVIQVQKIRYQREARLHKVLSQVDELAQQLQEQLPNRGIRHVDLEKVYGKIDGVKPVFPLMSDAIQVSSEQQDWARQMLDYCLAGASIAVASPNPVALSYSIALLATKGQDLSLTFGELEHSAINWRSLKELLQHAPGVVVIPASAMAIGSNRYEVGREAETTLRLLTDEGLPVIFTGTMEQLQSAFTAQGVTANPLCPILAHAPDVALSSLVRYSLQTEGKAAKGLSKAAEDELQKGIVNALANHSPDEAKQVLAHVCRHSVSLYAAARWESGRHIDSFVKDVIELKGTLSGLSIKPRSKRPKHVENNIVRLARPGLQSYLKEHIVGQDGAIDRLVFHLQKECLTRPGHQPLRWCAQGTPGTGKSWSSQLVAEYLQIPYINVDAASMADMFTASSQLLGGGRGLVGSDRSGRLEEAAQSPDGALIEVSDIDHAVPTVRSGLADLFLQVLETGEGQSGIGKLFPCSKVIFAFTMNLPDGKDQTLRTSFGFRAELSQEEIEERVCDEVAVMISSAFLSRVGEPIVFDPLNDSSYKIIVKRAFRRAILDAAARMGYNTSEVVMDTAVALNILESIRAETASFGARILIESSRALAANAFISFDQAKVDRSLCNKLRVTVNDANNITINPDKRREHK